MQLSQAAPALLLLLALQQVDQLARECEAAGEPFDTPKMLEQLAGSLQRVAARRRAESSPPPLIA